MLFSKNYKKNNLKNLFHIITLALVILFFTSINSSAQSLGRVINFQGRLTDQQGNPLDGTYDIIFSIYPLDPNSGPLWTEIHTDVNVSSGIVNVLLGSITSLDEPAKVTFDQERYLGITIDCDHDPNTKDDEMAPRQRILPAIYSYNAYNADSLDGKDSSEFTTPETDAGRPGVAEHLYEGSTRLVDKYIKQSDEEKFQRRVTGSCSSGYSIRSINGDGSVTCEKDDDTNLSKSTVQQWANEVDDVGLRNVTNEYGISIVGKGTRSTNMGNHKACFLTQFYTSDGSEGCGQRCRIYQSGSSWILEVTQDLGCPGSYYRHECYARCLD